LLALHRKLLNLNKTLLSYVNLKIPAYKDKIKDSNIT